MGTARSGSTLLGLMLHNCEGLFFGGELRFWELLGGVPWYKSPEALEFWGKVKDRLGDYSDICGETGSRYPDYPTLSTGEARAKKRRLKERYRSFFPDFFTAISRESSTDRIVDSSHYPWRARELRKVPGIRVILLYIVRDPQGVVNSLRRELRKGNQASGKNLLDANLYLWVTSLLGWFVFGSHKKRDRIFVRYEDLMADPEKALQHIAARIGPDVVVPEDVRQLRRGPQFSGNNILFDEVIVVEPGRTAVKDRSVVTAILQAPFVGLAKMASRRSGTQEE
jgi:hypothetical protein